MNLKFQKTEGETYELGGRQYPVPGRYVSDDGAVSIPFVDIKWMSDERWNQLARESAIKHIEASGAEATEANIEAYYAFLRTDDGHCGGELFNERLLAALAGKAVQA